MPKSKRNKVVHLTQVKKKGKDHKDDLLKQVEEYLKEYHTVYLFDFDSTKSDRILNLRMKLKGSGRIFAGRNIVVSMAFKSFGGKTKTDYEPFLKHVVGHKGLLFTNMSCDKLVHMLEEDLPEFREKLLGYSELPGSSQSSGARAKAKVRGEDDDNDDSDDAGLVEFKTVGKPRKKAQKKV